MTILKEKILLSEHLSYIIECVAAVIPGEAKTEIQALVDNIKINDTLNNDERDELIAGLESGYESLRNHDSRTAGIHLGRQSRILWKQILKDIHVEEVINTPSHIDGPRMWFPRLESAPDKRVLMGVSLQSGQEKPDVEDYCNLLAMHIQGLADDLEPEGAMVIAEDSLMMGSQVRMGDPTELGTVIVESDPALDILIQEAVSEIGDDEPGLPELERAALQQQAKELTFSEFVNGF